MSPKDKENGDADLQLRQEGKASSKRKQLQSYFSEKSLRRVCTMVEMVIKRMQVLWIARSSLWIASAIHNGDNT
jgi:hypothetical protein